MWQPAPNSIRLDKQEIHLWRAELNRNSETINAWENLLSKDELARAARFRVEAARRRFIAGRAILRLLLGRYLGLDPAGIVFRYHPHGKPYLAGGAGQIDLRFNLSHSHELALYAFALEREIGIDLEQIRTDRDPERLAARFFSPEENAALGSLSPEDRREAFFRCWTRKEAYLKARGEGLSIPLAAFSVSVGPAAALLKVDSAPEETSRWSLVSIDSIPGYAAALAVEGRLPGLRYWIFD